MTDTASPDAAQAATPPDPQEVLTLEQWAGERSRTDPRIELLNAHAATERAAGRYGKTRAAWNADYDAFASRPV